jgi:hypothetical protein
MAPEYASEGIFSIKSDVFSFGVLVLEILSGKRNSGSDQCGDFINLIGYVSLSTLIYSLFCLFSTELTMFNEIAYRHGNYGRRKSGLTLLMHLWLPRVTRQK